MKMKRSGSKKLVCLFLAFITVAALILGVVADTSGDKSKYSDLDSQRKAIHDKLARINSDLADAKSKKASALRQKEYYDKQIEALEELIEVSEQLIAECDARIADKQKEIDDVDADIASDVEIIRRRLTLSQEMGDMQYLDFLLGSSNLTEFFSRAEVMRDLFANDRNVLESLSSNKQTLDAKKQELEETKATYETLKADNEAKKEELTAKKEESVALIAGLEKDEQALEKSKKENQAARDQLDKDMAALAKKIKEAEEKEKNVRQYSGDFIWPVAVRYNYISQYYKGSAHTGLDIPTNHTPVSVFASAAGKVLVAEYHWSYGNYVVIYHGSGIQTLYAHLSKINVKVGQEVKQGDVIGISGTTGNSTGIHVHFMVYVNGSHTNPLKYVKQP